MRVILDSPTLRIQALIFSPSRMHARLSCFKSPAEKYNFHFRFAPSQPCTNPVPTAVFLQVPFQTVTKSSKVCCQPIALSVLPILEDVEKCTFWLHAHLKKTTTTRYHIYVRGNCLSGEHSIGLLYCI